MPDIIIDPEFAALIPPLKAEERAGLEASLKAEGCRDALVVWAGRNILLDGHNRYEICRREGISFRVLEHEFDSRADAAIWICENQRARRNLEPYAIIRLEERRAAYLKAKAERQMLAGLGADGSGGRGKKKNPLQISAEGFEPIDTRKEVAERSGYSTDTVAKVRAIEQHILDTGDDGMKQRLLEGKDTSINKEYKRIVEADRKAEKEATDRRLAQKPARPQCTLRTLSEVLLRRAWPA